MKRLCDFYIGHAGLIGVVYYAIPCLSWSLAVIVSIPFREVYLLRLGLSLTFGCAITAYLNRYGLEMWLSKHRGKDGPATVCDGALIGAAIGIGSALLPTLSVLIQTNHPEMAKTAIILTYLSATCAGAIIGSVLAAIGRKYVGRDSAGEEQPRQDLPNG